MTINFRNESWVELHINAKVNEVRYWEKYKNIVPL